MMKALANGELILSGLDCANCAAKIERRVAALDGVKEARLDFVSGRLVVEVLNDVDISKIMTAARGIAIDIEPDISIASPEEERETGGTERSRIFELALPILGAVLFVVGLLAPLPDYLTLAVFIASCLLTGGKVILKALRNILRGQVFDENFLMTIAATGAFCIGEYAEAAAVMLFFCVGEMLEDLAVRRSRRSIETLMDIRPDSATVIRDGEAVTVAPESVGVGEVILVRPGEKLPLDGVVLTGNTSLDTTALTGESAPRDAGPGSEVLSGSVNINGAITVSVSKPFGESTVSKILELVRDAGSRKSPAERFITRFARYYTPIVVALAALLAVVPPLVLPGAVFADWLRRALVFLVVSCPCALVISVPLGYFGGIGAASRRGVLVKGGAALDALTQVHTAVFDKTGTLTSGEFGVSEIISRCELSERELLETAAAALSLSNHPLAYSIVKAAGESGLSAPQDFGELAGLGVSATVGMKRVLAGNARLMESAGIVNIENARGTVVHVAIDGAYAGCVTLEDTLREYSREALDALRASGVGRIVMLTGDAQAPARRVADALGLDDVYAELLPHQKVERVEELMRDIPSGKLMFVGDGINDAPVLKRADIGVAMGGAGSDAAIEASDIVIMTDDTRRIADAVGIAKRTKTIVLQNIAFALGVKLGIMLLASFGVATMWEAVFGDVGVSLLAVANSLRALKSGRG